MFNFKKAKIYQALKWEKFPLFRFSDFFRSVFFGLFLIFFIVFLYGFLPQNLASRTLRILLGFSLISLSLSVSVWLKGAFFEKELKKPKVEKPLSEVVLDPDSYNLADYLSFDSAKAADKALKLSKGPACSTHLLYFLLKDNSDLKFIFLRALLDFEDFKKSLEAEIKKIEPSGLKESFDKTILEGLKKAVEKNHFRIEKGDLLSALASTDKVFKRILLQSNIKKEDIDNLVLWKESFEEKERFWDYDNLMKRGTLAREWSAGYTVNLDKFSRDLTEILRKEKLEKTGHKKEIKTVERILSRREMNNVLLIGEPGSGRKSIVYSLAEKSIFGDSLPDVSFKRVVELDMASLTVRIDDPEEVESVLDKIFQEAVSAGNIILVIDDFHNYVGQKVRPGVVDLSGIIAKYLHLPQFQIIALTDYQGLHRNIEKNSSILSLFEKVEVPELSKEKTLLLLEKTAPFLEKKYNLFISYPAMREVISLSDRYFTSPFPEKALDLLDEVAIFVNSRKEKVVLPEHVAKIVTEKTEVPVGELKAGEKETLLDLEELIHRRIINQSEAVEEVSTALRRARSEVTVREGPMGAFLFMGPTGVGKTETSKALAEVYFGSEKRMIRLDMSEFQNTDDIPRLIGSPSIEGLLTTAVREDPFSLVLLDEVEKAHPNILNLFLQVLDEGHLTDGLGRKVDFRSTIIIATSNAGYKVILKAIKEKSKWETVKKKLLDHLFEKNIFRPEFVNRFDAVVVFGPLSKQNLLDISELMLRNLKGNMEEKGIDFEITETLKEKIVDLGYDPKFGAREMRRVIQNKVENSLASALLSGELKRGDRVKVNPANFKIIIN